MKFKQFFDKSIILVLLCVFPFTLSADELVTKGKLVNIDYTLKLTDGTIVSSTKDKKPLTYIHGTKQIISGLEKALDGMKIGEQKTVTIKPEEAYGEFQAGKVLEVKKDEVKGELQVGAFLSGTRPTGEVITSRIIEIKDSTVILDFNHPMAGKTLVYDVKIVDVKNSPAS